MIRRLGKALLSLRFVVLQRHRTRRVVLERGLGFPLVVLPGVLNPVLFRTTAVLLAALEREPTGPRERVLDLGTGSGALAIAAAHAGAGSVVATDVVADAVRCARLNVHLNRLENRVEVRQGDLWSPVGDEHFELVLCNPPYYPGAPRDDDERPFRAGDFARRFADGLARHLAAGGRALVILSSDGDEAGFNAAFAAAGLARNEVLRRNLVTETVTVLRLAAADAS